MQRVHTFADANRLLAKLFAPPTSMREAYSLEGMYRLMELLGNPQNSLKVVHVAGTSGKTSTCYYISALLTAAGQKVGTTVSPHIDEVNERVQINREPLAEARFCAYFTEFLAVKGLVELKPSYFEAIIAFAFWVFAREKVDYAVIEVGLGGLGDATNVIDRPDKVCVITDIGMDHTQVLGETIQKIATQKAGIIHRGNAVVTVPQDKTVMAVIRDRVKACQAMLTIAKPQSQPFLQNLPPFGRRNWQIALTVYHLLVTRDKLRQLSDDELAATAQVVIPARMEVIVWGDKTIVFDGSHNTQKMAALRQGLQQRFADKPIALLTSFIQARANQADQALAQIIPQVERVIVTSFATQQDFQHHSLPVQEIAAAARAAGAQDVTAIADPQKAFQALLDRPEPVLLVTGSFYLLNHVRPLLAQKIKAENHS